MGQTGKNLWGKPHERAPLSLLTESWVPFFAAPKPMEVAKEAKLVESFA